MLDAHQLLWTQIAAGVCLLLFGGTLFNLLRFRMRFQAAGGWTKTEGIITASNVDQPAAHVSDDLNDATPIIRYRYRAGGQELNGDQVMIGGLPMTTRVLAGQLVARYPVGARVDVYIDPSDPKSTLLEPAAQSNLVSLLVFTVTFGFAAAILVAHSIAGRVLHAANGAPLFVFFLPAVAFLGAILAVVGFVRGRRLASASARWPTASGTITTSDVIEEQIEEKNDDDKSIIRKIYRYQVDLRYAYQIGNRDFVGTARNWGGTEIYGLRELAERAAGQYSCGQRVTVYYDPEQPRNAVLEPNSRKGSLTPLVMAVVCAVVGRFLLMFFIEASFN